MDGLTFTVEIVKALAWPATVVIVALAFRARISDLLQDLKKGKVGPAEFEFERRVKTIEPLPSEGGAHGIEAAAASPAALEALMERPRDAILGAWLELEGAALGYGYAAGLVRPTAGKPRNPLKAVSAVLSSEELGVLEELQELRNFAVHYQEFAPTMSSVLRYVDLAKMLQSSLERKYELLRAAK